ncbi:hypothetical protein JNUCC42_00580 [Brevibacterium sp. JNUCC-42]|nr:hypothetical protein JNUCC42_00580 [Brevibacterium sp. JNUCC-42]
MYTFENLRQDLSMNREVEFKYEGNWYSITFSKEGWFFKKFNDIDGAIPFKDETEIEYISINDRSLKEIFNNNEYEEMILY